MAPPPAGGPGNNKLFLGVLAGCGCLVVLVLAGVMVAMVFVKATPEGPTAPTVAPPTPMVPPPPAPPSVVNTNNQGSPADQAAVQYVLQAGRAIVAAAQGQPMDPAFGAARTREIPEVVALGPSPSVQLVVFELDGNAGRHSVTSYLVVYPDGRLRAAKIRLGRGRRRAGFDGTVAPALHGLLERFGNDMLQRGRCPHLLETSDVAGLPAPLVANLTAELGTSRSECRGLRGWPGFQAPWTAQVGDISVVTGTPAQPLIVTAQWRPRGDHLALSRIQLPRRRRR